MGLVNGVQADEWYRLTSAPLTSFCGILAASFDANYHAWIGKSHAPAQYESPFAFANEHRLRNVEDPRIVVENQSCVMP